MVINISKEGSKLADLSGHVVKVKDAKPVYDLIARLNKNRQGGAKGCQHK